MVNISKRVPTLAMFILVSVKARYPDFDYKDVLTEKGLGILEKVTNRCQGPGFGRPGPTGLTGPEALIKDWDRKSYVDEYFKMDETGHDRFKGPALVINGDQEQPWTLKNDPAAAKRMCGQGQDVQFTMIPGARHFSVLNQSLEVQLKWFANRFADKEIPNNCATAFK